MTSPLVVVLVVALGPSDEARTAAHTVQDALGSEAVVLLREEPNLDDSTVSRLGQKLRADALVRITWTRQGGRTDAHLHLYATGSRSWTDRDVTFAPDDPPEERGRALGYGIATMVRVDIPPTPTAAVADERTAAPRAAAAVGAHPRLFVETRFQAAAALGSEGGSLGGEGALAYRVARSLAVRLAGGLRGGRVQRANATTTYLRVGPGAAWTLFESQGARPFALGARLDVLALRVSASRSDGPSSGDRWMFGTDMVVEAGWAVLPRGVLVAGMGAEIAFESTRILVDARESARIAPARFIVELGVRIGLD